MYKLVICDDEGKTTIVPLIRDEISVGRLEGNTIRLTDRNVSRQHARLIRKEEFFFIEDLDSLCGTKVNGKEVKSKAKKVTPKDQISIGDYSLSIRTDVSSEVPLGRQMAPGDDAGIGKITSNARLVLLTDPSPGLDTELTADLYVIGRAGESNFKIDHPSISRAHTRLDYADGKWTISDLDSINGILINGLKRDDYVLKAGDIIELGSVKLRFVAPGEPYDYLSMTATDEPKWKWSKLTLKQLYLIGGAVAALLVSLAVFIALRDNPSEVIKPDATDAQEDIEQFTFGQLMEMGKDKVQSEEWAEAARLFAFAVQKMPQNKAAREMKDLAVAESDAQGSFTKALVALEKESWEEAFKLLSKIPRSSRYYDTEQLRRATDMVCKSMLRQARKTAIKGNFVKAINILTEIDGIPETSQSCREKRDQMQREFEPRLPGGAGSTTPPRSDAEAEKSPHGKTEGRDRKPSKQSDIDNPYE